jgi:hypothetical protein
LLPALVHCAVPPASDGSRTSAQSSRPAADRGLLASPGIDRQPMKGVYFFAGEQGKNLRLYTTNPIEAGDEHWNSDPSTRPWVVDRMVAAHVNTIVMSYWSTMPRSSPMALDPTSLSGVLDAAEGRPVVVLPAIESGTGWRFANEFPVDEQGNVAPGLVERVGDMVALFRGRMRLWAQMYDRDGVRRYAVNIIHASSNQIRQIAGDSSDDDAFARAFDVVAEQILDRFGVRVGFTLDAVQGQPYSATPAESGTALERTSSVLGIQGFEPEVWSGVIKSGPPCTALSASCKPYDNNADNLGPIVDWKREDMRAWVGTGVPVVLAVSNGMDGRYVWAKNGVGFWGDNHDYTDDRFRNWVSELKGGGTRGIVFDTWNGYTEGYAAVPSKQHAETVYSWLGDLLKPDPRKCSHVHYENGVATERVYGAICTKWVRLGGDRRFGAPVSPEVATHRGRVTHFAGGGSIFWSRATHAHEVHGAIAATYIEAGADASCLGLPTQDEEKDAGGRVSRFERGVISWKPGDKRGKITCFD